MDLKLRYSGEESTMKYFAGGYFVDKNQQRIDDAKETCSVREVTIDDQKYHQLTWSPETAKRLLELASKQNTPLASPFLKKKEASREEILSVILVMGLEAFEQRLKAQNSLISTIGAEFLKELVEQNFHSGCERNEELVWLSLRKGFLWSKLQSNGLS